MFKMVNVMDKLVEGVHNPYLRLAYLFTAGVSANFSTMQYIGDPVYHLSGAVSGAVGFALDEISTVRGLKIMNRQEFVESGLERPYESNSFMPDHPTLKQFLSRAIPMDILKTSFCFLFPGAGYTLMPFSYVIYKNNMGMVKKMEQQLEEVQVGESDLEVFIEGEI